MPTKRPTVKQLAKPTAKAQALAAASVRVKKPKDKATNSREAKHLSEAAQRQQVIDQDAWDKAHPDIAKQRKAREAKLLKRAIALEESRHLKKAPFIQSFADEICERLSEGEDLTPILQDLDLRFVDIKRWMDGNDAFRDAYSAARENHVHKLISQVVGIADDPDGTVYSTDQKKLRIEVRKWLGSKVLPKLYGDKIVHSGDAENPLVTKLVAGSEELLAKIRGES